MTAPNQNDLKPPPAPDFRGWVVIAGLIHLLSACWHIFTVGVNSDEGFYAIAARSVMAGDLPYRDFGYTQMPLLPYINGAVMQLIGFGLFEQRITNGIWGAGTLLLAGVWLARRSNPVWATGCIVLLSLSAPWMAFIHLGKTYAFTGLTIMAALWVYTEWTAGVRKLCLLSLLATLGIGCRLPSAPFFAVLWLAAAFELRPHAAPKRVWLGATAQSLLWPAVLLLPFYLLAPEAASFWSFEFHRLSVPTKGWSLSWQVIAALAPALWLGLLFALGHSVLTRTFLPRSLTIGILATLTALALNLMPSGVYEEYGIPFLPVLLCLTAAGLWQAGATLHWLRHAGFGVGLMLLNLGASLLLLWPDSAESRRPSLSVFLPPNSQDYDLTLRIRFQTMREIVRNHLHEKAPFIGPNIILAVEADRIVPPRLRMGPYTVTEDFSPTHAARLNLVTFTELEAYFTDTKATLLSFYKTGNFNYAWSMPTFRPTPKSDRMKWLDVFRRDFVVLYEDKDQFILIRKHTPEVRH